MPGIHGILQTASRTMWASQTGVEVSSHNIANINTPGYSRQQAQFDPSMAINVRGLMIGTGVDVTNIRSVQDRFLSYQIFAGQSTFSQADTRAQGMSQIEEIFNEAAGYGLTQAFSEFFSALHDLGNMPDGESERITLVGAAENLTTQFHQADERLRQMQKSADQSIGISVGQVNSLLNDIASLNKKIAEIESGGQSASDLRSQRTTIMQELAGFVDFSSYETDNGMVNITLAGGYSLVEGAKAGSLTTERNDDGFLDVFFESSTGRRSNVTDKIEGGSIGGDLQTREVDCQDFIDKLDELAYTFLNEFNNVHNQGTNLNGNTGVDFFWHDVTGGTVIEGSARTIRLSAAIQADTDNIAASLTGEPGDNQNALALAQLESAKIFNGGTWTILEYNNSIIANAGSRAQSATRAADQANTALGQVEGMRESLVGVSYEDEMASLMEFQSTYQAAARVFNVVQDMLDTLYSI
ncbi:flagellar hook-associated protein FlgK [bacterium]|nr:flagellar hook-associated protein FlgK [bacterium]